MVVAPATELSAIGGSETFRVVTWPVGLVAVILSEVGTECRASAITCSVMLLNVSVLARLYSSHSPAWWDAPNPGCQAVVGLPSMAAPAPALRSPGNRPSE